MLGEVGGSTFFKELVGTFLADAPRVVEQARQTAAKGRADDLRRAAHTVKASAGSLGARRLAALSAELESLAPGDRPEEVAALIHQIGDECLRACDGL